MTATTTTTVKTNVIVRMVTPHHAGFGMWQAGEAIDMSKHAGRPIRTLAAYERLVRSANRGRKVRLDRKAADAVHGNCYGQDGTIYAWVFDGRKDETVYECVSVVDVESAD